MQPSNIVLVFVAFLFVASSALGHGAATKTPRPARSDAIRPGDAV